jgi:GTP-binding protein
MRRLCVVLLTAVAAARADGKTTVHALGSLEARGVMFAGPGTEVYAGMIIGESSRGSDLEVNPIREKKLTNVRAAGADDKACWPYYDHICYS